MWRSRMPSQATLKLDPIRLVVHVGAVAPLIVLILQFVLGGLTANPIRDIQLRTGQFTLAILTASLTCTPLFIITGWQGFLPLRRPLGLYAFGYASLHVINVVGLDYQFNLPLLWRDSAQKRYILAGIPAFLILLLLALTSTDRARRWLGKGWRPLHRFVYLAAALGIVHYLWETKIRMPGPFIYGGIIAMLLLIRIPWVRIELERLPWRRKRRTDEAS